MITLEARLRCILTFEKFKLLSKVDKIRGSNESVVEIVSLENVIDIECLDLIYRDRLVL